MKKILSAILLVCMLLALAACGSSGSSTEAEEPAAAEVIEEAEAPAEEAAEPAAEEAEEPAAEEKDGAADLTGMKAALVVPLSSVEALNQICENFVTYMGEYGVEAVYASCEGDTTMCNTLIENYAADHYDIILVIPLDENGLEDSITAAREGGTKVCLLSNQPAYEIDGGLTADMEACGYAVADMAAYWVESNFPDAEPDSIGVAVVAAETPSNYKRCKEAMVNTMNEGELTYCNFTSGDMDGGSMDAGFTFAENALTSDPDIRVFLTQENEAAKGINNYLLTRTDLDLENFAIFSINSDITSIALVTQASDEPTASILRGLIPYGSDDTGRVAADIAYGLLSGEKEAPYWIFDELHTINTFGWTLDMAPAR